MLLPSDDMPSLTIEYPKAWGRKSITFSCDEELDEGIDYFGITHMVAGIEARVVLALSEILAFIAESVISMLQTAAKEHWLQVDLGGAEDQTVDNFWVFKKSTEKKSAADLLDSYTRQAASPDSAVIQAVDGGDGVFVNYEMGLEHTFTRASSRLGWDTVVDSFRYDILEVGNNVESLVNSIIKEGKSSTGSTQLLKLQDIDADFNLIVYS